MQFPTYTVRYVFPVAKTGLDRIVATSDDEGTTTDAVGGGLWEFWAEHPHGFTVGQTFTPSQS